MLVKDALPKLGEDVVMVSLDGDPNESAQQLRRYADDLGFRWRFAIASREVMASLAQSFGNGVLYPPSDPMFVVTPKGAVHQLPGGHKDEQTLREAVQRYRGG